MMSVPSRVLDFWQAYDRIEPIGDQWLQTASICQVLSEGHGYQLAAAGVKHEQKGFDHYMPVRWRRPKALRKKPASGMNVNMLRSRLEQKYKA